MTNALSLGGRARFLWCLVAFFMLCASAVAADPPPPVPGQWIVALDPANAFSFVLVKGGMHYGDISVGGWGPHWSWAPFAAKGFADAQDQLDLSSTFVTARNPDKILHVREVMSKTAPDTLTFKYTLSATEDLALTEFMTFISLADAHYQQGTIEWSGDDDKTFTWNLPIPRRDTPTKVKGMVFKLTNVGDIHVTFDPPMQISSEHNNLRMVFAADTFPTGSKDFTITYKFPAEVVLCASQEEVATHEKLLADEHWFDFTPASTRNEHSVIGMEDWLGDGKDIDARGGIRQVGDHFEYANTHQSLKIWGSNLNYTDMAPSHADADITAARFAKYGVNCVRMLKFCNSGWEGIGSPD